MGDDCDIACRGTEPASHDTKRQRASRTQAVGKSATVDEQNRLRGFDALGWMRLMHQLCDGLVRWRADSPVV